MPARTISFEDGSRITWKDRETLQYEEPNHTAWIWLDFEPGFFRRGRVLRKESLMRWHEHPEGSDDLISSKKQSEIIDKVHRYLGNTPLRVVDRKNGGKTVSETLTTVAPRQAVNNGSRDTYDSE